MHTVTLKVDDMHCGSCTGAVTKALQGISGTDDVKVILEKGIATLNYSGTDDSVLVKTVIDKAGKPTSLLSSTLAKQPREVKLTVKGMSCGGCSGAVTRALEGLDGTEDVNVSLEEGVATLKYHGDDDALLIKTILDEAGKEAQLFGQ